MKNEKKKSKEKEREGRGREKLIDPGIARAWGFPTERALTRTSPVPGPHLNSRAELV